MILHDFGPGQQAPKALDTVKDGCQVLILSWEPRLGRNHPSFDSAGSLFLTRYEAHPLRPQWWRCYQGESDLTTRAWGRLSYDSTWQAPEAFELERSENVAVWAKNDHLGFEILYVYKGVVHKFRPDFLIGLANGTMLVLEVKGQDTQQDKAKRKSLDEWVRAVNRHSGFGRWAWEVSRDPCDIAQILELVGSTG